jgi:hypothetical protein
MGGRGNEAVESKRIMVSLYPASGGFTFRMEEDCFTVSKENITTVPICISYLRARGKFLPQGYSL